MLFDRSANQGWNSRSSKSQGWLNKPRASFCNCILVLLMYKLCWVGLTAIFWNHIWKCLIFSGNERNFTVLSVIYCMKVIFTNRPRCIFRRTVCGSQSQMKLIFVWTGERFSWLKMVRNFRPRANFSWANKSYSLIKLVDPPPICQTLLISKNSRGTLEGKYIYIFDAARRASSDYKICLALIWNWFVFPLRRQRAWTREMGRHWALTQAGSRPQPND